MPITKNDWRKEQNVHWMLQSTISFNFVAYKQINHNNKILESDQFLVAKVINFQQVFTEDFLEFCFSNYD